MSHWLTRHSGMLILAAVGWVALLGVVVQWRQQTWGWRCLYIWFALFQIAWAAWEYSFAVGPTREWIRVDLIVIVPFAGAWILLLAGRSIWVEWRRIAGRRIPESGAEEIPPESR